MNEGSTIAYQPALDGVRALAVAAVLLFHAEVPGFDGGYLGVSVFFTLSGYLITSLLVHEHDRRGSIALGAFYSRRVRRLLPASTLCLLAIVVASSVSDVFVGVADLPREIAGAILQIANWVFLAGEGSYQEIFEDAGGTRSPVEHFWSLAIEEQFYWVWPPTMVAVLAHARSQRGRTVVVGALTAVFVVLAPVTAVVWGPDAAYWATPARIAEILLGALLAVVFAHRQVPARAGALAPVALAALAVCVVVFPASGGPAYEGWLPAIAVGSAALVLGLQVPGPLRSMLSLTPFVWLGRISYGVYLFHWPIFVILDEPRTGLDGTALVVLRLAVTLVVAQASFTLFEQPLRRAKRVPHSVTFGGGVVATAAVVVVALTVVPQPLGQYWLTDDATVAAVAIEVDDVDLAPLAPVSSRPASATVPASGPPTSVASPPTSIASPPDPSAAPTSVAPVAPATVPPLTTEPPAPTVPALSRPVRIVVAGDSTALATGTGLLYWAAANPHLAQVEVVGAPGCGFLLGGERRESGFRPPPDACRQWREDALPSRVAELQPDVVMMMVTSWDLVDHRWDGVELTPLDDPFERRLLGDYARVTEEMLALGAGSVAWVKPPIPNVLWRDQGIGQEDPARHDVARRVMDGLATARPADVGVVDLATWLDGAGLTDDREVRPDGVHFEPTAAVDIASTFLGEQLVLIAVGA